MSNDKWATDFDIKQLQKCTVIHDCAKLPFECWIIPGASGIPQSNPMYFRRMPTGESWLFEPYGEGRFFDAVEVMKAHGPFRLLHPAKMTFKGDDRPIFENDEEREAYEKGGS